LLHKIKKRLVEPIFEKEVMKIMTQLYEIDCDSECGFMVRSHDKSETVKMAIDHVKEVHGKDATESETTKMVKMV
jgi:predicted small metal-binding protein